MTNLKFKTKIFTFSHIQLANFNCDGVQVYVYPPNCVQSKVTHREVVCDPLKVTYFLATVFQLQLLRSKMLHIYDESCSLDCFFCVFFIITTEQEDAILLVLLVLLVNNTSYIDKSSNQETHNALLSHVLRVIIIF